MKRKSMKQKQVAYGPWEDFIAEADKFLKQSKILSTVGNIALPALAGSAAGLFTANPIAAGSAAAGGSALNEWIKSQGYGKKRMRGGCMGRGKMKAPMGKVNATVISQNGSYQQTGYGVATTSLGYVSPQNGMIKI